MKSFTPFAGGGFGALIEADARQCQSSSFLAEKGALFSPTFKLEMPSIQFLPRLLTDTNKRDKERGVLDENQ